MDLVDQLKHLKKQARPRRRGEAAATPRSPGSSPPDPQALVDLLDGVEVTQEGERRLICRRIERPFEGDLSAVPTLLKWTLGNDLDVGDVVFLDTETTGLAGGTGTVAFLVGLAHWRDDHLVVEQGFMPDYPDEPALLDWVRDRLGEFAALISYNGKTFDLPLLRTRWRLAGERGEFNPPHLDLLPVARRLFAHRLDGCSLANVEHHVLGFGRGRDLPGRAAPRAFFRYLEGHEVETMAAVFRHNESDLLATSLLLARVAALHSEPSQREFGEPGDWLGLGDWAEQLGDLTRAHEAFSLALGALRDTPQRTKIELQLADLSRRLGREEEALELWRAVAERDPLGGWPAVREIARWHEGLAQWRSAYEVLDTAWQRFEQVRGLRTLTGASRLPAAWRQWMSECERLRTTLRQASQEEQLTLAL